MINSGTYNYKNYNFFLLIISISIFLIINHILLSFSYLDKTVLFGWNVSSNHFNYVKQIILFLSTFLFLYYSNILKVEKKHSSNIIKIFITLFILCIFLFNMPEINPDCSRYITEANYLENNGLISVFSWGEDFYVHTDYPTVPFIYSIIFKILGGERIYIQYFNAIIFSLMGISVYLLGTKFFNSEIGYYAAFITGTIPHLIIQVPLTLPDVFLCFIGISTLALYAYFKDTITNNLKVILALLLVVSSIATIHTKIISGFIIILLIILYIFVDYYLHRNKTLLITSLMLFSISIIVYLINLMYNGVFLIQLLNLFTAHMPSTTFSPYVVYFKYSIFFQIGVVILLLVLIQLYYLFTEHDIKLKLNIIFLYAWILIPLIIFYNTRLRYVMFVYPAIGLLASKSIYNIKNKCKSKNINLFCKILLILIISNSIALLFALYMPSIDRFTDNNLMDAGNYINNELGAGDSITVFALYDKHQRRYYGTNINILRYHIKKSIRFNYQNFESISTMPDEHIVLISDTLDYRENNKLDSILYNYKLINLYNEGIYGINKPSIVAIFKHKFSDYETVQWNINGEVRNVIYMHPNQSGYNELIIADVLIPKNSTLDFGIAMNPSVWDKDGDGVIFEILVREENHTRKVFYKYINPKINFEERKWNDFKLCLENYDNKHVDIILRVSPNNNPIYDWSGWSSLKFQSCNYKHTPLNASDLYPLVVRW